MGQEFESSGPTQPELNEDLIRTLSQGRERFQSFLRKHVADDSIASDLLQQASLNALRHAPDWDAKENSVAWFYRILRNVLIDHYRAKSAETRKAESLAALPEAYLLLPDEDKSGLCSCFQALLPGMKPEYADLIRRIDLGEEKQADVALELDISSNALSVRLHRARQSLKTNLERTCGLCTEHGCLDCTCKRPARGRL